jgi:hypothetical protein
MIEVLGTDEFEEWFLSLDDSDATAVARIVGLLEARGTALGFPYTSAITSSHYPTRELRIQSGGRPLRVFYAFDPKRQAVLLLGGDKTGDRRFYARLIPRVEALWESFLRDFAAGEGE